MKVAQTRNAVLDGKFYFRKDIFKGESEGWGGELCSLDESVVQGCSCITENLAMDRR